MKIAAPTNDRNTLAERSGRAKEFAIFEIIDSKIISTVFIENEHEKTHHNGDKHHNHVEGHGHDDLVALLSGIDAIVGKKFGPHFSRDFHNANIIMKLSKEDSLEKAVLNTYNLINK